MAYPSSLDSLSSTRGTASDTLSAVNHVTHHTNEDTAIEALEAKVGVDGSAVTTTHDYKLSGVTGSDKAASKTGSETLTNKTLTAPVINAGSDATGDIYYRSAGGVFTRLAIGSNTQILQSNGTIPAWVANPSASNGSTTVAGIFEAATAAQVTAGTATGETGAALAVTPDALAASTPIFNGSGLTNISTGKLHLVTTDVTLASSTSETDILSYSLAGGVLGTNNVVKVTVYFSELKAINTETCTLRFKYGATTLVSKAFGGVETFNFSGKVEFILAGSGATNTQNGVVFCSLGAGGYIGNGNLEPQYFSFSSQGTSAIDSTSSGTIAVSGQMSASSASDGYTVSMITVELLK